LHAQANQSLVQALPLLLGPLRHAAARPAHPRVDLVFNPVVIRWTHQDACLPHCNSVGCVRFSGQSISGLWFDDGLARKPNAPYSLSSVTNARKKGSASVTMPMVWWLPRSASFVTVAGLISTQVTFTQAGSKLPVAMACKAVATIRAKPTPRMCSRI